VKKMAKGTNTVEVTKAQPQVEEPSAGFTRAVEHMFGPWMPVFPFRHPFMSARHWLDEVFIPVDEVEQNGTLVVRAEMAGIDPDSDVQVSVSDGLLHIAAHRREEETTGDERYIRKEMRYGAFERDIPIPEGVAESDVTATYKDGILEVKVPLGKTPASTRIPVTKS
jgi:HSP20 family protein